MLVKGNCGYIIFGFHLKFIKNYDVEVVGGGRCRRHA